MFVAVMSLSWTGAATSLTPEEPYSSESFCGSRRFSSLSVSSAGSAPRRSERFERAARLPISFRTSAWRLKSREAAMRASLAAGLICPSRMSAVWSRSISDDVNFWKMEARSSFERFSTAFVNIHRPSASCFCAGSSWFSAVSRSRWVCCAFRRPSSLPASREPGEASVLSASEAVCSMPALPRLIWVAVLKPAKGTLADLITSRRIGLPFPICTWWLPKTPTDESTPRDCSSCCTTMSGLIVRDMVRTPF